MEDVQENSKHCRLTVVKLIVMVVLLTDNINSTKIGETTTAAADSAANPTTPDPCTGKPKLTNINYAGLGYDAMVGNPHSDLYDPGFRQAVLLLEYKNHSTTSDGKWLIPDGAQVLQTVSCSYDSETAEMMGTTSYQNSLSVDAKVEGDVFFVKFSASASFKEVREGTTSYRRSYVSSVARCLVYKASINYKFVDFRVTSDFAKAVAGLPTEKNDDAYSKFLKIYGTHFASTLYMGARLVLRNEFEQMNWTSFEQEKFDVKAGAKASFRIFTVGFSSATEKEKRLAKTFDSKRRSVKATYLGSHPPPDGKWETWARSSWLSPYPIQYTLTPLTELFTTQYFPDIKEDTLATTRNLLNETFDVYCRGIKGCGLPDPDRKPVKLDLVNTSFIERQNVRCRPDFKLLSCGIDNSKPSKKYDLSRYAIPTSPTSCQCNDSTGANCIAWCTNVVEGFQIVASKNLTGDFTAVCPKNKKVLGCHVMPTTNKEQWSQHYPADDGNGCRCHDSFGAYCYASCASNVRNHEVLSQFGKGNVTVTCSPDNFVLGCGARPDKRSTNEKKRTAHVASIDSCLCYDGDGITCYAICGKFL